VWVFQNAKNYTNWVDNGEVVATLVVVVVVIGYSLDATTSEDTLYNNIHDNYGVVGLIVSLMW